MDTPTYTRDHTNASPAHVLIVDDEAPIRRLVQTWVEPEGVRPLEAEDADEALDLSDRQPPAVAFCDLRLRHKDGLWLARQLRARHPDTAVFLVSGRYSVDMSVTGREHGVVDFLPKPFTREQLVSALAEGLAVYRQRCASPASDRRHAPRCNEIAQGFEGINASVPTLNHVLDVLQRQSPEAREHARRVARLAFRLGRAMGLDDYAIADIERAALLHGPDYADHAHPVVAQVESLATASAIAAAMHAGSIGPAADAGSKPAVIPLGARILSAVDAYDALVHGIGRDAVLPVRALDILLAERGREFDGEVIDELVKVVGAQA